MVKSIKDAKCSFVVVKVRQHSAVIMIKVPYSFKASFSIVVGKFIHFKHVEVNSPSVRKASFCSIWEEVPRSSIVNSQYYSASSIVGSLDTPNYHTVDDYLFRFLAYFSSYSDVVL